MSRTPGLMASLIACVSTGAKLGVRVKYGTVLQHEQGIIKESCGKSRLDMLDCLPVGRAEVSTICESNLEELILSKYV